MLIDDYLHVVSDNRQTYTDKEIGVAGIRLFGHMTNMSAQKTGLAMHIHPGCIEICYIVRGNQTYTINDEEYFLTGDNVFVAFQNQIHGSGLNPDGKFELYWIQLEVNSGNFLELKKPLSDELLTSLKSLKTHKYQCSSSDKALIETAFKNLACDDICGDKLKKIIGVSSLVIFLSKIAGYDRAETLKISPAIQKAKNYIENNPAQKISLGFLAEYVSLSLSHFKKLFKRETGETPNDYINYLKIQKSKEMLKSGLNVTETAFSLGFSSSSYFAAVFKHYTGMPPTEYRE